jgi:uncharacterized protein
VRSSGYNRDTFDSLLQKDVEAMPPQILLTNEQVRAALIKAQGLAQEDVPAKATKDDVRRSIRQMQLLQIDTISVVARSPYLVLWSRLGEYEPNWLEELLEEGAIFEYWAHAACFLPIEDLALFRSLMAINHPGPHDIGSWIRSGARQNLEKYGPMVEEIMLRIHSEGPVRSADFKRNDGKKGQWWDWKQEKIILEALYAVGDLMIARRHNFQRVYDLTERVAPSAASDPTFTAEEVHQQFVVNTVRSLGVTKESWIADYYRLRKDVARKALKEAVKDGRVVEVEVVDWDVPGYTHPDHLPLLERIERGDLPQSKTMLLSPFDPIVWDRKRGSELFDFDYQIECYTPEPKRIYGYFTLPILYKNQLIGRLDAKAHRKEKLFEVKALHLEPDVKVNKELVKALKDVIERCADWHRTPDVVVRQSNPEKLATMLK